MKPATTAAVVLLAAIAILHLLRLVYAVEVTVAGMAIPRWASALATLIPGLLAVGVWREQRPS